MNEERMKVLQMLSEQKITAEEAAKLLSALQKAPEQTNRPVKPATPSGSYRPSRHTGKSFEEQQLFDKVSRGAKTMGKAGQQMGMRLSEEIQKAVKDEDFQAAGKKIGSKMKDLGSIIRDEVNQAMIVMRKEIVESKKNGSQAAADLKGKVIDIADDLKVKADNMSEEMENAMEEQAEKFEAELDSLRDAMGEVADHLNDLQDAWTDWNEEDEERETEEIEAFISEMHNDMAELSSQMAEVVEQCVTLQQMASNENETKYADELTRWAKTGNEKADVALTKLEADLAELQVVVSNRAEEQNNDIDLI